MTPNWYDLLDVDRHASAEEIRAAWRSAIADLEPDDRRFRVYNEAGAVLLDPARRADYDATLVDEPEPEPQVEPEPVVEPEAEDDALDADADTDDDEPPAESGAERGGAPVWVVAALALLALALVVTTVFAWTRPGPVDEDAARAAARVAVIPVLSYDYRTLDEDMAAAHSYMTPGIRKDYDATMEVIKENAPNTKTVVTVEEPLADGVVRSSEGRVDVLLYLNMPTTNAQGTQTYRNQVTLQMKLVGDEWLVDDFRTNRVQ